LEKKINIEGEPINIEIDTKLFAAKSKDKLPKKKKIENKE
jgi:hypothetical protein